MQEEHYRKCCVYCGGASQCRDHIIAACTQVVRSYSAETCVSCCTDCNSLLSNFHLPSIQQRAAYLHKALRKHPAHAKLLKIPKWELTELEILGNTLRKETETALLAKELLLIRIENTKHVSQGFIAVPINDVFAVRIKERLLAPMLSAARLSTRAALAGL